MEKILQQYIDEFRTEIDQIKSDYFKFEFNSSNLPDVVEYTINRNIRKYDKFEKMFHTLENLKTNCLYWFSVNSIEDANQLIELISL
jgi:hypothetical protein